jgi:hypothetical protein
VGLASGALTHFRCGSQPCFATPDNLTRYSAVRRSNSRPCRVMLSGGEGAGTLRRLSACIGPFQDLVIIPSTLVDFKNRSCPVGAFGPVGLVDCVRLEPERAGFRFASISVIEILQQLPRNVAKTGRESVAG